MSTPAQPLFLVLLVKEIMRPSHVIILGLVVLLYSLPHIFVELEPRYHRLMLAYMVWEQPFRSIR